MKNIMDMGNKYGKEPQASISEIYTSLLTGKTPVPYTKRGTSTTLIIIGSWVIAVASNLAKLFFHDTSPKTCEIQNQPGKTNQLGFCKKARTCDHTFLLSLHASANTLTMSTKVASVDVLSALKNP